MKKIKNYTVTPEQLISMGLSDKEINELFNIPDLSAYKADGVEIVGDVTFMLLTNFDTNEIENVVQLKGMEEAELSVIANAFSKGIDFDKPLPMFRRRKGMKPKILGGTKRTYVFLKKLNIVGYWYVEVKCLDKDGNETDEFDIPLASLHNEPEPAAKASFPNKHTTIVHQLGLQIKKGKLLPDSDNIHNYLKKWYTNREYSEREDIIELLGETDIDIVRKFYPMSNPVFDKWIDSKCKIKYPSTDGSDKEAKVYEYEIDGEKYEAYMFYSAVGSISRVFDRMLKTYFSKENQERKIPRKCHLILSANAKWSNTSLSQIMNSRLKGITDLKNIVDTTNIWSKYSDKNNTPLDDNWFEVTGFRLHSHEEITKTHIDRLVTVEEVKIYIDKHRGKRK